MWVVLGPALLAWWMTSAHNVGGVGPGIIGVVDDQCLWGGWLWARHYWRGGWPVTITWVVLGPALLAWWMTGAHNVVVLGPAFLAWWMTRAYEVGGGPGIIGVVDDQCLWGGWLWARHYWRGGWPVPMRRVALGPALLAWWMASAYEVGGVGPGIIGVVDDLRLWSRWCWARHYWRGGWPVPMRWVALGPALLAWWMTSAITWVVLGPAVIGVVDGQCLWRGWLWARH